MYGIRYDYRNISLASRALRRQKEGPATEEEIKRVEQELGRDIAEGYKDLLRFSRHLEFRYEYDEEMPDGFQNNYSGEISWSLGLLKEQLDNFREWVEVVSLVPARHGPEAAGKAREWWADKLPSIEVANGDIIVVGNSSPEVIYFSCKEFDMHGRKL